MKTRRLVFAAMLASAIGATTWTLADERSVGHQVTLASLPLPVEGEIPSLGGATEWLNSEPLTAAGLRGKVVLIEFWTYSCINWLRTLPYRPGVGGKLQGSRTGGDWRARARVRV
jgi:hypothetical protein